MVAGPSPSARQRRVDDVEVEVSAGGVESGGAGEADKACSYWVASSPAGAAGADLAGTGLDENDPHRYGPVPFQEVIAERAGVSVDTVQKTARAYAERGSDVEATIRRKKRQTPPVEPKVTGEVEARLIALACSSPPEGRARWSLRLLEKHVALIDDIPDLDHSTIGKVLKRGRFVLI